MCWCCLRTGDDDASDPAVSRFSSIARSCTLLRCRVTGTSLTAAAGLLLLALLHVLARCRCCCCGASIFVVAALLLMLLIV